MKNTSYAHVILIFICVAGTIALAVFSTLFAMYYNSNKDKLVLFDAACRIASPDEGKDVVSSSFKSAESSKPLFQWGGCRPQNMDRIAGTFSLHCWGLAKNEEKIFSNNGKNIPLASGIEITAIKKADIDNQKVFLSLLAAFCYEKLHFNITADETQK